MLARLVLAVALTVAVTLRQASSQSQSSVACSYNGLPGTCEPVSDCTTEAFPGLCPGPSDIQCCLTNPAPPPGACAFGGIASSCESPLSCVTQAIDGLCGATIDVCCVPAASNGTVTFPPEPAGFFGPNPPYSPRANSALTGSQWAASVLHIDPTECAVNKSCGYGIAGDVNREIAVLRELFAGNMPGWSGAFQPVITRGNGRQFRLWAAPDFLSLGSDSDYFRFPLSPYAATFFGDAYNLTLPTKAIIKLIYAQATYRVVANPLGPSPDMTGGGYYYYTNAWIQSQLIQAGAAGGELVGGHKKNPLISSFVSSTPQHLDFYGWYKADGTPIQTNPFHDASYADYSHGLRMIASTVEWLDDATGDYGQSPLYDLLSDPLWAGVLNANDDSDPSGVVPFDASLCYRWCDPTVRPNCSLKQNDPWLQAIRQAFPSHIQPPL